MPSNDDPTMRWLAGQKGSTVLGAPPLTSPPNPLVHKSDQVPFAGRPGRELSTEENNQRQQWMADEARRLIAERQRTGRPATPVTVHANQIFTPRNANAGPQQAANNGVATELIQRLAARDRGMQ
ncbi:hypothetical protein J7E49_21510 [Variovorax paradoxus]|nr:hypothetical protein [Variovorax paradoxus]